MPVHPNLICIEQKSFKMKWIKFLVIYIAVLHFSPIHADNYICIKNGLFFVSNSSEKPLYLRGINYPKAISFMSENDSIKRKENIFENIKELKNNGITLLRMDLPLKVSLQKKEILHCKRHNNRIVSYMNSMLKVINENNMFVTIHLALTDSSDNACSERNYDSYIQMIGNVIKALTNNGNKRKETSKAIFSWEIELPQKISSDIEEKLSLYEKIIGNIKKQDSSHLISISCSHTMYDNSSIIEYERLGNIEGIDYLNIYLDPLGFKWTNTSSLYTTLPNVYIKAKSYLEMLSRVSQNIGKPIVIANTLYPRDRNHFEPHSPVDARNSFFYFVKNILQDGQTLQGTIPIAFFGNYTDEKEIHKPMSFYPSDNNTISFITH